MTNSDFFEALSSRRRSLWIALLVLTPCIHIETGHAQQRTFYEGFETTEPGTLPDAWSSWQNGGGGLEDVHWSVFLYNPLGSEKYVMSPDEPGRNGMIDEDWLITPKITPAPGDRLMFNTRRSFFESGDHFYILVSSTTNEAPDAFTDTLAAFTEADVPAEFDPVNGKFRLDLAEYVNTPVHFAFVHVSDVGDEGISSIWLLDDIEVRPVQPAYIEKTYFRQATTPSQPPIKLDDVAIPGSVSFILNGDYGTVNISKITLGTTGTSDVSLIKRARLYYTPEEFIVIEDIVNEVLPFYGSTTSIGTTFEITGDLDLELGSPHYFWLVYDLDTDRQMTFPYPQIDVTFERFVVNGEERIPETKTFPGSIDVVPSTVVNDNFEDAIEINASGRFGSSTFPATYENLFDKFAWCQNFGFENVHSVWWHFTAPTDGTITVDLADSKFNTLLVFFDEELRILECNDDASDTQLQSKIENFTILRNQKIYIRVSDMGGCCGSEYSESGVVDMDFRFAITVGTPDSNYAGISALYPNPASRQTSFDVNALTMADDIRISVSDMAGRILLDETKTSPDDGTVTMETSELQPGTYLVKIQTGKYQAVQKLIITSTRNN